MLSALNKSKMMDVRQFVESLGNDMRVHEHIRQVRLAFIHRYDNLPKNYRSDWLAVYNTFINGWQAACRFHDKPFHFSTSLQKDSNG